MTQLRNLLTHFRDTVTQLTIFVRHEKTHVVIFFSKLRCKPKREKMSLDILSVGTLRRQGGVKAP